MNHRIVYLTAGTAAAIALGIAVYVDWVVTMLGLFGVIAWNRARWHKDRADESG